MLPQSELNNDKIINIFNKLTNAERQRMRAAAQKMGRPEAAQSVVQGLFDLVAGRAVLAGEAAL